MAKLRSTRLQFFRLTLVLTIAASCSLIFAACGHQQGAEAKKSVAPPARVENAGKESDLATVILTPQAESRLGVRTAPVEHKRVMRSRTSGGEVIVPPGRMITVSAPIAGTLSAPAGSVPVPGTGVKSGQPIFRLLPLLPPERDLRVQVEREVASAEARVQAAHARVNRAEQLLRDKAGSARAVEEAREGLALAEAELKAARARLDHINKTTLEAEQSLVIPSPQEAIIQKVHVTPGQTVSAGTILFEVASLNPVWIRVPVYVGDLASFERGQPARIHGLADPPGAPARSAKPVPAPPSADLNAATVDLFFAVSNQDASLRPGQKVGVTLTLRGGEESLVVPWSAILHDIHGGTWVYENSAPQVFVRRRVEVRYVAGTLAVLARGPAPGTKVVITGAAEIFGTEFGAGK